MARKANKALSHWRTLQVYRQLKLLKSPTEIVALLSSNVVLDSFVVVKDRRVKVLMDHVEGFQRFRHTWEAILACKSLFLTIREMLNISKHAGLLQVEVSAFVDEMMITCCCVC